jgi:DNA invertase Pin-like site-specific DNA recombinase
MSVAALFGPGPDRMGSIRGRGRPKVDADPEQRSRHSRAATAYLSGVLTREEVCRAFEVTPMTLGRWIRKATAYPESKAVRALRGIR